MSEISELFANVGVEKDEKKHIEKKKEHKKIEKHEIETKHVDKKKEIHKKLHTEGVKIQKNALKKEIVNNSNSEKEKLVSMNLEKALKEMILALGIEASDLNQLIDRESGFDTNAKSPTGAKGIMQLTSAPLQEMEDSQRGAANYMHIFKKMPYNTINTIKNEWLRTAFIRIKEGDKKVYDINIKEITSRAKDNSYCNLIVGCIYLSYLKEQAKSHDKAERQIVISNLKKIKKHGIDEVNKLLTSKNKNPITNKDLDNLIAKLSKDKKFYAKFLSFVKYNGDNTKQAGIPHKYLYAVAVIKGTNMV